jgi:hypothetical protein
VTRRHTWGSNATVVAGFDLRSRFWQLDEPVSFDQRGKKSRACGVLTVLEKRSDPQEGKVQLPVVIVPSKTRPPEPDPVVYMAGGPGAMRLRRRKTSSM